VICIYVYNLIPEMVKNIPLKVLSSYRPLLLPKQYYSSNKIAIFSEIAIKNFRCIHVEPWFHLLTKHEWLSDAEQEGKTKDSHTRHTRERERERETQLMSPAPWQGERCRNSWALPT
jgi:hypothetical protein